ncbi:GOLPH3/VPS74 family protein [Cryptosporangium aurantiacum]|uniref:Golgi phosphoprotein 3 (GPP34) n=1 Tax=Cryptosporangium aurantiacum TaxID=134849 RepID=A0A1M7MTU1_9ACTN|nr:GPP34 family phosphoprotein [Cryptosporangium aurantiacum]SHM93965.1 Golgi phosphoprotein 3 (GPP34) [Cryptosporangium aurantiacum]
MTVLPLPDELLLLAYDDAAGKPLISTTTLDLGLAAAVLVELALAGRIVVEQKKVRVTDPTPVDEPVAEAVLDRLRAASKPRDPRSWLTTLSRGLREKILDRLVETGVVEREESKVLGLFRVVRYPALNPAPETAAHGRLDAAVRHGDLSGRHTVALASLVRAVDLGPKLFPDLPAKEVKSRLDEISEGEWAGKAVKEAIAAIGVALTAATSAAVAATITTSVS